MSFGWCWAVSGQMFALHPSDLLIDGAVNQPLFACPSGRTPAATSVTTSPAADSRWPQGLGWDPLCPLSSLPPPLQQKGVEAILFMRLVFECSVLCLAGSDASLLCGEQKPPFLL